jgi:DNA invertase Pin-like site-specific DNA recombinase
MLSEQGKTMQAGKFVAYLRVSTTRQGQSGLGLEAQRHAVAQYLQGGVRRPCGEFIEVESGKGSNALARRPQLRLALDACKKHKATLVIAKLDRLARNVHFVSGLLESGVEFVAADMPEANKVMLHMHAVMAEWERDQISARTKAALAAAKARGVRLGVVGRENLNRNAQARKAAADEFAERLRGVFQGFRAAGMTQRRMARELNNLGIRSAQGSDWSLVQVQRVIKRQNGIQFTQSW